MQFLIWLAETRANFQKKTKKTSRNSRKTKPSSLAKEVLKVTSTWNVGRCLGHCQGSRLLVVVVKWNNGWWWLTHVGTGQNVIATPRCRMLVTHLSHCWSGPCLVPFGVMEPEMRMCKVESVSDLIKNKAKTSYTVFFFRIWAPNSGRIFLSISVKFWGKLSWFSLTNSKFRTYEIFAEPEPEGKFWGKLSWSAN